MNKFIVLIGLIACSAAFASANSVGLVIGGVGGGNSLEVITPTTKCLGSASKPQLPLAPSGNLIGWFAQFVENKIYLCGGQDVDVHNECHTLSIGDSNWQKVCDMIYARRYAASVAMPDGRIVVLGGYNNQQAWLDSVEVKATGQCQFTEKTEWKMPRKMFDFCAVALNNTHIFIVGGNMYGKPQLDNADILDTVSGTWHSQNPMPSPRSAPGCTMTEINGEQGIIVTGGLDSQTLEQYKNSYFYSISSGNWIELDDLVEERMGHKILRVGPSKTLTIVGGYNQVLGQMNGIELYNDNSGWSKSGTLNFARYHYGSTEIPADILGC